ncbi:metalloprotease ATP23 [Abortiporus biennis]|nr:metalloprotease ATP23 [Abortiporus biennis]
MSSSSTEDSSSSDATLFTKWSRRFSQVTGLGLSEEERVESNRRTCEKWKAEMMHYSPAVVFMMKHLQHSGCDVSFQNLVCVPCNDTQAGGFIPESGAIGLCQNRFMNKAHMEDTMVHELIHMFDHCKFKVDWNNLRHHACSEIRANSLSGDCRLRREFDRGFFSFSKQHQACVRRRAVLSVRANPACPDEATAERVVNEVWESCFNDTRPFDEIY